MTKTAQTIRANGGTAQARAWQRMLSGRRLDLLDPSPLDVEIEDIAHGLARVARWNGQTQGEHAFSVAQHCVLVEDACIQLEPGLSPDGRLAALLHDAAEYVIGDMISPFKAVLGDDYKTVEVRIQRAVHLRFALQPDLPERLRKLIKRADGAVAYFEATRLAGFGETEARRFFGKAPAALAGNTALLQLEPWSPEDAQAAFLERFQGITDAQIRTAASGTKGNGTDASCLRSRIAP